MNTCEHCGRPIDGDPDNGGDPWHHVDTMQARCDGPDDEEGLGWGDFARSAEPHGGYDETAPVTKWCAHDQHVKCGSLCSCACHT